MRLRERIRSWPAAVASSVFLALGLAVLMILVRPPGSEQATEAESPRAGSPSIVLVVTDDQRWDTLAAMPTVSSELVAKGVTFTNAFVVNPLCCPSRATILTGLYSHTTKIYGQKWNDAETARSFLRPTIATRLDEAGYETIFAGKYLNGYDGSFVPPGWDRWTAFAGRPGYYGYELVRGDRREQFGARVADYSTDVLARTAAEAIRTTPGTQPLFLLFAPFAPHVVRDGSPPTPAPRHAGTVEPTPWTPPSVDEDVSDKPAWLRRLVQDLPPMTRYDSAAVRAGQLTALKAVDDAVRRILTALEDTGRLANTLIIFTSDNGFTWGEHRLGNWKLVPYDESIRVPLVLRFDGRAQTGRNEPRIVANVDLAPTVMGAAGGSLQTEGRSLLPLAAGTQAGWRGAVLVEHIGERVPTYCAVRGRRWMYARYADGSEELYDMTADPYQLTNVAYRAQEREARDAQRQLLRTLCRPAPPGFVFVDR